MKNKNTIHAKSLANGQIVQVLPDGSTQPFESKSDWEAFDALTEEEITVATLSDPDGVLLSDEQLAQAGELPSAKTIRQKLQMTQEQFSTEFGIPLGTLRDWEQGVSAPDTAARSYLRVIARDPQAVLKALK
jgi:putative transcriptional regulator